ncbi:hypothetical protein N9W61_03625, partial [Algibacter sp.]|nr:hypothetical protein [Algibacter sp.]
LIGATTSWHLFKKSLEIKTYTSPDGNYTLTLRLGLSIFLPTMPGDGGNPEVIVILKDAHGNLIGTSNSECAIFKDSITVEWDMENEQVWYGKAKTINLKTGKVEC